MINNKGIVRDGFNTTGRRYKYIFFIVSGFAIACFLLYLFVLLTSSIARNFTKIYTVVCVSLLSVMVLYFIVRNIHSVLRRFMLVMLILIVFGWLSFLSVLTYKNPVIAFIAGLITLIGLNIASPFLKIKERKSGWIFGVLKKGVVVCVYLQSILVLFQLVYMVIRFVRPGGA